MEGWWAASYLVLWGLVIALCVIVVALARQIGTLHLRLGPRGALELDDEGPPLGEGLLPVETADAQGRPVIIGGPGRGQLLLFVSPGCRVCADVLPSIAVVARSGRLQPVVITDVDAHETLAGFGKDGFAAPIVPGPRLVRDLSIPGTPYVVVLDRFGVVRAKGTVNNLEQMEGLVETAARRLAEADRQVS